MTKVFGLVVILLGLTQFSGYAQSASDIVLPRPNSVVISSGTILLSRSISISQENANDVMEYLKSEIEENFDIKTKVKSSNTDIVIVVNKDADIPEEGYALDVTLNSIIINASTQTGAFYGVQTLVQLMRAGASLNEVRISCQKIVDAPSFSWRSYMLDESRYFLGKKELFRLIDVLAELKINVLHWHLTDDAGWRLEIKKYPKLTEIGSKRKDTEIETWGSGKTTGEPHEGFYTQKDVKEILKYAKQRHIKVVPEIEMPGHATAAIAAYPWLGTKKEKIEVPVKFGKHYHTYDVIDPRVQLFLQDVVTEVIELFDVDVIHIGGDEVRFDHWEEDADMVAHKKNRGFSSFMDIQIEFTNNMSRFIEKQGCSMMGWNEILGTNLHKGEIEFTQTSTKVAPNVIVQFWKGDIKELVLAAKQGYRLVNSFHEFTYLDYNHKRISLEKAYSFTPIPEGLDKEYHDNIIGLGCQMWREWAPTVERVHEQTFPRIAAYAEVGWTQPKQKEYGNFIERLDFIAEYWQKSGIHISDYK